MAYARRLAFAFSAAAVVAAWIGCGIYDSSLLLPAPSGDGGPDASDDSPSNADGDSCGHARPPARPSADDGSGDHSLVVAIHSLDFGAAVDAGSLAGRGYDLDGVCTCPGPESCTPWVTGLSHCDDDAGRDDGAGQLLKTLAILSGGTFSQDSLNARVNAGDYGLVVRIQNYNGGQNDTQVVAAIFASDGTPTDPDAGTHPAPKWDGNDAWTIDSASVFGGSDAAALIPNFADSNAYVANGVLVAKIDFPLTLGSGSGSGVVTLSLVGGFVTARIVPEGSTYALKDGQLVGRWPTKQLLSTISTLAIGGQPLCPGSQAYKDAKSQICRAADITSKIDAPESAQCDALSLAVGFEALPAMLGDVVTKPPAQDRCPDAGAPDDCP